MKTGTIIVCSVNAMPLIKHYGIVINNGGKDMVAHNSPDNRNKYGGSVVIEPYNRFMKGRTLISKEITRATLSDIMKCCYDNFNRKYDSLSFNCFQFTTACSQLP